MSAADINHIERAQEFTDKINNLVDNVGADTDLGKALRDIGEVFHIDAFSGNQNSALQSDRTVLNGYGLKVQASNPDIQINALETFIKKLNQIKKDGRTGGQAELTAVHLRRDLANAYEAKGDNSRARLIRKLADTDVKKAIDKAASISVVEKAVAEREQLAIDPFRKPYADAQTLDAKIKVLEGLVQETGKHKNSLRAMQLRGEVVQIVDNAQKNRPNYKQLKQDLDGKVKEFSKLIKEDAHLQFVSAHDYENFSIMARDLVEMLSKNTVDAKELSRMKRALIGEKIVETVSRKKGSTDKVFSTAIKGAQKSRQIQEVRNILRDVGTKIRSVDSTLFDTSLVDTKKEESYLKDLNTKVDQGVQKISSSDKEFIARVVEDKISSDEVLDGRQEFFRKEYKNFLSYMADVKGADWTKDGKETIKESQKEYAANQLWFGLSLVEGMAAKKKSGQSWGIDGLLLSLSMSGGKTVMEAPIARMIHDYARKNGLDGVIVVKPKGDLADNGAKREGSGRYLKGQSLEDWKGDIPVMTGNELNEIGLSYKNGRFVENPLENRILLIDEVHEFLLSVPMITSDGQDSVTYLRNLGQGEAQKRVKQQRVGRVFAGVVELFGE